MNCLYVGVDGAGLHMSFKDTTSLVMAADGKVLINGPMGATGIQKLSTFTGGILLLLLVLVVIQNMVNSRTGRAIMAIRDNRIAAEASGVPVTKHKLIAFVTSAAMAGAAGALYALNYSSFVAAKFDFNSSILLLVYVVLGGLGNMSGTIISTALLVVLPEMLRFLQSYRMLIYAIVLIAIMLISNNETLKTKAEQFRNKLGASKRKGAE
jgi:branched-chain amino acid transport system permease protein